MFTLLWRIPPFLFGKPFLNKFGSDEKVCAILSCQLLKEL